jgi:hypothetical protein
MVDEDAPKKSLTDAITKAASHLGIAANIFLGRWDDNKYVAEVAQGYAAEGAEKKAPPVRKESAAPFDPAPHITAIEAAMTGKDLLAAIAPLGGYNDRQDIAKARVAQLVTLVRGAQSSAAINAFAKNFRPDWPLVSAAADARKAELEDAPADNQINY